MSIPRTYDLIEIRRSLLQVVGAGGCTVLNNQRVAVAVKHSSDTHNSATAASAAGASDAVGMSSDVLVDNGRIVLQYRNVNAANVNRPSLSSVPAANKFIIHEDLPASTSDVDSRTGSGHVFCISGRIAEPDLGARDYDMNDVVWKNMAASTSSTKC